MSAAFKEGDRVQIADRVPTTADEKSGLFYAYFRGLTGTVQKVFATEEVAVEIETESLNVSIAERHREMQEQLKAKWLDGLSETERNRLSEAERNFRLRYTVLVHRNDLKAPSAPRTLESPPARVTSHELDAREEEEFLRRTGQKNP
jgi:ribosomal protein L21E